MPLQIRRGTTAQRLSITPLVGELVYDLELNTVFVGNGTTPGGISAITGLTAENVMDVIGQMFVSGVHKNINFIYGATQDDADRIDAEIDLSDYDGEIVASAFKGSLFSDNSTLLIDAVNSAINLDGTVKGDVIPDQNETYDLGSATNRFRDIYLSGSSIKLGDADITATGTSVNLPLGSTINGLPIGTEFSSFNIAADDSTQIPITQGNTIQFLGGPNIQTSTGPDGIVSIGTTSTITAQTLRANLLTTEDSSGITVATGVTFNSDILVENEIFCDNNVVANIQLRSPEIEVRRIICPDTPSDAAMRITNTSDTGSIFVSSNNNILIKTIGNNSRLLIGAQDDSDTASGFVDIVSYREISNPRNGLSLLSHHNGINSQYLNFIRTRGTVELWDTVNAGDNLGRMFFWGAHAQTSEFSPPNKGIFPGAGISVNCTDTPIGTAIPAKIVFSTTSNSSSLSDKAELTGDGEWKVDKLGSFSSNAPLSLVSMPKLPSFADETAATASVGGFTQNGMMYYDLGANKIKVYENNIWVTLTV
jgi:hypothetical protein